MFRILSLNNEKQGTNLKIDILLRIVSTFIFIASLVQYIIDLQSLHVLEVIGCSCMYVFFLAVLVYIVSLNSCGVFIFFFLSFIQYFHPDNMSASEKLKLELKKVRDEFKMSESDCGSARVQGEQYNLAFCIFQWGLM